MALKRSQPFLPFLKALERTRRKLAGSDDGDRQMVKILAAVLTDGLPGLIRSGVRSAIGGTEAAYDAPNDQWVVHVHLLVFGEIKRAIARLKVMAKSDGFERPVKRQRVRDPVSQVTYLQKFVTYHRPGKASAGGKGWPYPLKPRHVAELARWFARRRFGDFAFLLGFRRRGSRIVAEPSFADIVAEAQVARWRRGDVATSQKRPPA